jgi:carbon monoxide dehydrogenase subunit G
MNLTGEAIIAAPRERVYEALNDPEILQRSIPGCEEIEKLSDTEMSAKVVAKVGPIKAKFDGHVVLSDLQPPESYTISGQGKGGSAGFAKGSAKVRLEPDDAGTVMYYEVQADVGGKLAQLGGRLIDGTAKKLAEQFFTNFGDIVGEAPPEGAPEAVAPPPAGAAKEEKRVNWLVWAVGAAVAIAILALLITQS